MTSLEQTLVPPGNEIFVSRGSSISGGQGKVGSKPLGGGERRH